jgi:hypothetical protein
MVSGYTSSLGASLYTIGPDDVQISGNTPWLTKKIAISEFDKYTAAFGTGGGNAATHDKCDSDKDYNLAEDIKHHGRGLTAVCLRLSKDPNLYCPDIGNAIEVNAVRLSGVSNAKVKQSPDWKKMVCAYNSIRYDQVFLPEMYNYFLEDQVDSIRDQYCQKSVNIDKIECIKYNNDKHGVDSSTNNRLLKCFNKLSDQTPLGPHQYPWASDNSCITLALDYMSELATSDNAASIFPKVSPDIVNYCNDTTLGAGKGIYNPACSCLNIKKMENGTLNCATYATACNQITGTNLYGGLCPAGCVEWIGYDLNNTSKRTNPVSNAIIDLALTNLSCYSAACTGSGKYITSTAKDCTGVVQLCINAIWDNTIGTNATIKADCSNYAGVDDDPNCKYGEWSAYSECNASGKKTRTRAKISGPSTCNVTQMTIDCVPPGDDDWPSDTPPPPPKTNWTLYIIIAIGIIFALMLVGLILL